MANNYNDILALLKDANGNPKNEMTMTNTMKRANGIPLDFSSVQESVEAAKLYAQGPKAYVGQPISVGDTLYIVTGVAPDYIKAVGTKPSGDGKSIDVSDDGKISIKGFETAANAYLPRVKVTDGARELEWVPVSAVVQADGNTRTVVEAADGSAITVNEHHDTTTDTYTYTLDVSFPAPPEYSVKKTVNEDGSTKYELTKDGTKVGDEIVVPKAYDDSTLSGDVAALKTTVGEHASAITELNKTKAQVDTFFATVENPDEVVDTLAEIQKYIADDQTGANGMLQSIQQNTTAISTLNGDANTAGSVAKQIADAISESETEAAGNFATKAALADVKATADAAAKAADVENALKDKADASSLSAYRTIETSYSKDDVDALLAGIKGEYGETADTVAAALQTHEAANVASFQAVETKQGHQDTAIQKNANDIASINTTLSGVEDRAAATAQEKVNALANGTVAQNTTRIADLETDVTALESSVGSLTSTINGESGLSKRIGALETAKTDIESRIGVNEGNIEELTTIVGGHTTDIANLVKKDGELDAAIKANTDKFADYSTTEQVEDKIDEKIAAIDNTARDKQIQDNKEAIAAEVTRATAEEARIAGLVSANTTELGTVKGQVSGLNTAIQAIIDDKDGTTLNSIKDLAVWVEEHESEVLPAIEANATAIAKLNGGADVDGSVQKIVADAIAGIPAIPLATSTTAGLVMGSDHISIEQNGAMKINMNLFTTDALQQGTKTLVLNGGSAN